MLAKQLAYILTELCSKSDLSTDTLADIEQRFEALRGSGRLPRGRESRGQELSDEQIVAGVLGLVAGRPSWAGMVCASMAHLKPVGGKTGAFGSAATLTDALSNLLADKAMRDSIIGVRLSAAEAGTNSHGLAVITYERDGARRQLSFVRDEAVSLLQSGASFDAESRNAPVSRELVFNRRFFEQLARRIEDARAQPSPPIGDGSEYDKEDAENARRQLLGVTSSSNFLNIGVDNQVTWPREEMLVNFDRYKFVLMPKTKEHVQSIHVDLHANKLSIEDGMTVINRFLSVLTWCDDQFAIAQDGGSGSPVPIAVPKRNLAFSTTHYWVFDRDIPASEEAQRALALYREARNAEQNFLISYAVLSYFKVLEVRYPEGKDIRPWVARTFPLIRAEENESDLRPFLAACGGETVEDYLWKACRLAVAHVREKHPSDPDIAQELTRLHHAADVMRLFARYFIRNELDVSDSPFREVERD